MNLEDPSRLPRGPRRFIAYWIRDLASGFDSRGFLSLIPFTFAVCVAAGLSVGLLARKEFFLDAQTVTGFYTAILALNAILLAVCWSCFSRLLDILGDPEFGSWMRLHKLDGYYGFYIDYVQLTQMLAVGFAVSGLVVTIIQTPDWVHRSVLGGTITASAYATRWAVGCVRLMQEVSDHRATFRDRRQNVSTLPSESARQQ